jgi:hypothetical protein
MVEPTADPIRFQEVIAGRMLPPSQQIHHYRASASGLAAVRVNDPRPIEDWLEYRRGLDRLESELRVSHPDLSWLDELQSLKAEADAAIGALTP